jgi:hypothetical protein
MSKHHVFLELGHLCCCSLRQWSSLFSSFQTPGLTPQPPFTFCFFRSSSLSPRLEVSPLVLLTFSPSDSKWITPPVSGSPACRQQMVGFLRLHNYMSQFWKKIPHNLCTLLSVSFSLLLLTFSFWLCFTKIYYYFLGDLLILYFSLGYHSFCIALVFILTIHDPSQPWGTGEAGHVV